jgi:CheY-like chemotaxis protein
MQSDPVSHAVGGRRLRLLILDDEDAILLPLSRFFEASGYDVVATREAEEAEAILSCETFDVAIIDLSLSGFGPDGLEVLRSIRARLAGLPVVVFSANVRPEVEEECWRLGATAVLTKPQPLEVLARVVARALGARP